MSKLALKGEENKMLYKAEAVVIRSMDYGEGNKIITLYARQFGKLSVMARGAKKMNSRHAATTQLFTYGEFTYYKSGQMGTLNQGEMISSHHSLRNNIHKTAYAAYIVEMIDRMLTDQEASSYLFDQLIAALKAIEDGKDPIVIAQIFEMNMLVFAGYAPELDKCVCCDKLCDDPLISTERGGMVCLRCAKREAIYVMEIQLKTLKMLRMFREMDLRRVGKINISDEIINDLKKCMRSFMDTHVSISWKSRGFLDQMEKYNL